MLHDILLKFTCSSIEDGGVILANRLGWIGRAHDAHEALFSPSRCPRVADDPVRLLLLVRLPIPYELDHCAIGKKSISATERLVGEKCVATVWRAPEANLPWSMSIVVELLLNGAS